MEFCLPGDEEGEEEEREREGEGEGEGEEDEQDEDQAIQSEGKCGDKVLSFWKL